jgi:hypothetical protein
LDGVTFLLPSTTRPFKHHFALAFLIHSARKIIKSCPPGYLKTNVTYEKSPKAVPSACPLLASWGQFVLCLASLPISRSDAAHNPAAMRPRLVWRYGGLPTNTSCHALHQLQNSGNGLGYYGICSPPYPIVSHHRTSADFLCHDPRPCFHPPPYPINPSALRTYSTLLN